MLLYIFEELENFVAKRKCSILKTKKIKINKQSFESDFKNNKKKSLLKIKIYFIKI